MPYGIKNVLVDVHYTLNLPPTVVELIIKDADIDENLPEPSKYSDAIWAIQEKVKDNLPDYLDYAVDEPEIEADG